jgi:hypothetical protein
MINIDLPLDEVAEILHGRSGATFGCSGSRTTLTWADGSFAEVRDACPDPGTDVDVYDLTERRGWALFDLLVARTDADIWMMDDGGLLLSARGLGPDDLGLQLATERVPSPVISFDEDGNPYEWSPLRSGRDGILVERAERGGL